MAHQLILRTPYGHNRNMQQSALRRIVVFVHLDVRPKGWQQHLPQLRIGEGRMVVAGKLADLTKKFFVIKSSCAIRTWRPWARRTTDNQMLNLNMVRLCQLMSKFIGEDGP